MRLWGTLAKAGILSLVFTLTSLVSTMLHDSPSLSPVDAERARRGAPQGLPNSRLPRPKEVVANSSHAFRFRLDSSPDTLEKGKYLWPKPVYGVNEAA
jgi:hypothetical protein